MGYTDSMLVKLFNFSKKYFFAIFTLSVIFVGTSQIWAGKMVYRDEDLRDVQSGFPFGYHSIDFIGANASPAGLYLLPQKMNSFSYPGQGYRTTILPLFFLNIAIVQVVFMGTLFLLHSMIPRADYFFRFLSIKYILLAFFLFLIITIGPKFIPIGKEQLQNQGVENHVTIPPSFVNPAPIPRYAN